MDSRFVESYTCLYEEYQANNQKEVWDLPSFYSFYQILKRTITTNRSIHNSFYTIDDVNTDRLTAVLLALPKIVQGVKDPGTARNWICTIADQETKDFLRYLKAAKRGHGSVPEPLEIQTEDGYVENPHLSGHARREEPEDHMLFVEQINKIIEALLTEPNGEDLLVTFLQMAFDNDSAEEFAYKMNEDTGNVVSTLLEFAEFCSTEGLMPKIELDYYTKNKTWTKEKVYALRKKTKRIAQSIK